MTEVRAGRYAGPFKEVPFNCFAQSPIGLVPKNQTKFRMIFHLSYDFGSFKSVNHYIPKDKFTIKYNDLDSAVKLVLRMNAPVVYFGLCDISNAFRIVPCNCRSRRWTVLKSEDPTTGKTVFFVDKNLPFGSSISCNLFQRFSNGLKHIVEVISGRRINIVNYLDDFLFLGESKQVCNSLIDEFMRVCNFVGVPVASDKTVRATTRIIFLGILLDGESEILSVPMDKRLRAINMLLLVSQKRKETVKNLQRLAGYLNFLNKAIFPGRAFTRRMYAKFDSTVETRKLKQFHHVSLDSEFKQDCKVWLSFLEKENRLVVCKPMVDLSRELIAQELDFTTDASSGLKHGGFGGFFAPNWFCGRWETQFLIEKSPSINYLELAALTFAVFLWSDRLRDKRVVILCDNKSVRDMVNSTSGSTKNCMVLIRLPTLRSMEFNMRIFVRYLESKNNDISDALSRQNWSSFRKLTKKMDVNEKPDMLPDVLWPLSKLWIN